MVTIRAATVADQARIQSIIRAARINPRALGWQHFMVANSPDGAVVGVGQVKEHRQGTREIASIAVTPSHMKMGIAALLIDALVAREAGDLFLYCERGLAHFYRRFGFLELSGDHLVPADLLHEVKLARFAMRVIRLIRRSELQLVVMRRLAERHPVTLRAMLPSPAESP